jgi:hypothetical protein
MTPRPSGAVRRRSAIANCGSPKNSVPPPSSSPISDALELRLALVGVEEGQERAQVRQVDQRQAVLVGVMEDEREALLLRLVRAQDLAEQLRPEVGDRRAHRHAGADPAERQVLGGKAGGRERQPELGLALLGRLARLARLREPRQVALHVGGEHRHAGGRQRLGEQLQRARLAGAGRARDQPVAVHHRQGDPHHGVLVQLALVHPAPEVDRRALGRVARGDRLREVLLRARSSYRSRRA